MCISKTAIGKCTAFRYSGYDSTGTFRSYTNSYNTAELEVPFDEKLWQSSTYQRVFQYLNRHKAHVNLDQFRYIVGSVEGNSNIFLQVVYR